MLRWDAIKDKNQLQCVVECEMATQFLVLRCKIGTRVVYQDRRGGSVGAKLN